MKIIFSHLGELSLWVVCVLVQIPCPWGLMVLGPQPGMALSLWAGAQQAQGWGQLSPTVRATAVLTFAKDFYFMLSCCSLGVKNWGLYKASQPEEGASVLGLFESFILLSLGTPHSGRLWADGGSGDGWKRLGQSRNKHTMNITTWLSLTNSKLNAA